MRLAGLTPRLITAPTIASCYVLFRASNAQEADTVAEALRDHRIGFRVWYGSGVHRHAHFREAPHDELEVTNHLGPVLIGLPVAPDLDGQCVKVCPTGVVSLKVVPVEEPAELTPVELTPAEQAGLADDGPRPTRKAG